MLKSLRLGLLALSVVTPSLCACSPEESSAPQTIAASEIEWKGIFGKRGKDERQAYVLMAREFMGIPFLSGEPNECEDMPGVVTAWLGQHPTANAIPVRQMMLDEHISFVFVWVVDARENLNVWLVRKGCAQARQMEVDEVGDLFVKREEYAQFVDSVKKAEAAAIQEKAGIWGKPGGDRAAHWTTAEKLEEQGKYAEAIAEFRASIDGGDDDRFAWHRIGRCYEAMQQYQAAIEAYDESLRLDESESSRRLTMITKARCVAKLHGTEEAAQVFGSERPDCSKSLEPCMDLAVVHSGTNNFAEAVQVMENGVRAFLAYNEMKFDGLKFVLDEPRAKRSEKYWLAVHELGRGLPPLAMYAIRTDDQDRALRYAAMALSVNQAAKRYLKDRYDPAVIEAGDFDARLVLARVYAKQGKFDEAKHEVDQAKILIDVGFLQGGYSRGALDAAYEELRREFPDRKVEIPPAYQPKAEKKSKPPSPDEVAGMAEDQLIASAAADDPAAAFAALEELVVRHSRGEVSPAGLARLVKDGLERQADVSKRWLAQYGVFIEDAWDKGTLPEPDRMRYIRGAAVVHEFDVSYSSFDVGPKEENARVMARGMVDARVGGSLAMRQRSMPKARLSVVVTLDKITLDGVERRPAVGHMQSREPNVIGLHSGAMEGFGAAVADTRDLGKGAHTLTATGNFAIYRGDLTNRRLDFDWTAVEPLAVVPFSATKEFEVERE